MPLPFVGIIAKFLISRSVSTAAAGRLAGGISIAGMALVAFLGWQIIKHQVIKQDRTEQRAEVAEERLKRTNTADRVDSGLEKRDEAQDERLQGVIDHAAQEDPRRGTGSVGPVSNAAVDELRRRRQAEQRN
jgi:hypothetical protein